MIQYVLGEVMLADIGTKALTAARLELLKRLMGMGKLNGESEEEEKKGKDEVEEKRRTGQPADKQESRLKQAAQVIKLITLAHPFRSPRLRMKKEEERNQFHLESSSSTHHLRGPSDPDDPEALECWSTRSRIYSPTCFGSTRKSHRSNWRRRKRRCLQRRNRWRTCPFICGAARQFKACRATSSSTFIFTARRSKSQRCEVTIWWYQAPRQINDVINQQPVRIKFLWHCTREKNLHVTQWKNGMRSRKRSGGWGQNWHELFLVILSLSPSRTSNWGIDWQSSLSILDCSWNWCDTCIGLLQRLSSWSESKKKDSEEGRRDVYRLGSDRSFRSNAWACW